ncbi:MAG: hypothetical protein L0Y72_22475 [Gemmataceae bacterium]|nr:hypothetical protein [Gemmataceae bacterium]
MAADPKPHYRVDQLAKVNANVRAMLDQATTAEWKSQIAASVNEIVRRLETDPLEWGDPEYRTKKAGGVVCHGIHAPLLVQYVVFDVEKVVCILDVKALVV